jgi:hypothetical protein
MCSRGPATRTSATSLAGELARTKTLPEIKSPPPFFLNTHHLVNTALWSDNRDDVKPWVPYIWLLCNTLHKLPRPEAGTLALSRLPAAPGQRCGTPVSMLEAPGQFCFSAFSSTTSSLAVLNSPFFLGPTGERVAWVLERVDADMARDIRLFEVRPRLCRWDELRTRKAFSSRSL